MPSKSTKSKVSRKRRQTSHKPRPKRRPNNTLLKTQALVLRNRQERMRQNLQYLQMTLEEKMLYKLSQNTIDTSLAPLSEYERLLKIQQLQQNTQ